ncbi:acyl carrier protein [Streptomyces sp. NPDC008343]|uniref:acyl carrier protein n=1 Tax=Streptomyces sp. NPDC008343 TaxID=3364828 RepID=UPI0036E81D66
MRMRLTAARPIAVAALTLLASAVVVPSAHSADRDYTVTLTTSTDTTGFDHRTVDLTGTLTGPDGKPAANHPVQLEQSVLFNTWNPWGDPIDPTEWETRSLGTVRTDSEGRFKLEDVPADRWDAQPSHYLDPRHEVLFRAMYDTDNPTDGQMAFADAEVSVQPVASSLSYRVSNIIVRAGMRLTVTGKVTLPAGHGPVEGTRVFLRQYYENEYQAQATTDAAGNFTINTTVRGYDNEFVLFSAPEDYYISGASKELPVKNITR